MKKAAIVTLGFFFCLAAPSFANSYFADGQKSAGLSDQKMASITASSICSHSANNSNKVSATPVSTLAEAN